MTEQQYADAFDVILSHFGGSYARPSGWLEDGLAFSCVHPPVEIPDPKRLTPYQRACTVARFKEKLLP